MSDISAPQSQSFAAHVAYVLSQNPVTMIAFGMLGFLIFCALFGPALVPYDPLASSDRILQPPSWAHWFGTDQLGRDILAQMLEGGRVSMAVGWLAMLLTMFIGTFIGMTAGYFKRLDGPLMRFTDLVLSLPILPITLVAVTLFRHECR